MLLWTSVLINRLWEITFGYDVVESWVPYFLKFLSKVGLGLHHIHRKLNTAKSFCGETMGKLNDVKDNLIQVWLFYSNISKWNFDVWINLQMLQINFDQVFFSSSKILFLLETSSKLIYTYTYQLIFLSHGIGTLTAHKQAIYI